MGRKLTPETLDRIKRVTQELKVIRDSVERIVSIYAEEDMFSDSFVDDFINYETEWGIHLFTMSFDEYRLELDDFISRTEEDIKKFERYIETGKEENQ